MTGHPQPSDTPSSKVKVLSPLVFSGPSSPGAHLDPSQSLKDVPGQTLLNSEKWESRRLSRCHPRPACFGLAVGADM